jgi:hypothetical protein
MFDVRFDRRTALRVGGLATLALPTVLRAEATGKRANARARSVILVYLGGGLSHHDSFNVGELLPMMAKAMDKVALIRSGAHNNDHHETATNWVMSGRFGSAFGDYPAIGAVVAHETGFTGTLPPYVSVPRNPSFTWELGKSAFLGGRYESFKAGDPNQPNYRVQDVSPADALSAKTVARRGKLLDAVDGLARKVQANDQITTYDEFRQRASAMILSGEARKAFAIDEESDRLRDRYGRTTFGQSCLLARRLVEGGVRFVTVNYGGWDHHSKVFENLDRKLPEFDRGFSALIGDLTDRGLMDDTLVVCMGEFGRTPKINKDAGRDHWGPAGSLLVAGAGVRPGNVIGATDKQGAYVTKRPVSPADVAYTIFDSLGIDPRKQLVTPDGRPIEILDQGELVKELF